VRGTPTHTTTGGLSEDVAAVAGMATGWPLLTDEAFTP
jgi:hypothetical protein